MESPVKMQKVSTEENKENIEALYESDEVAVPIKGIPELPDEPEQLAAPSTAVTIKEDEETEPILQENPQRFVLFPIKYHEVWILFTLRASTRKVDRQNALLIHTIDMANVQESRSVILDRRRNRLIERSTRLEQATQ